MNNQSISDTSYKNYILYFAAFVIIVAAIKSASEIVVILLLAIFISSIISSFLKFLASYKIPKLPAYFIVFVVIFLLSFLLLYMINNSLGNFAQNLPIYDEKIKGMTLSILKELQDLGFKINKDEIISMINFTSVFKFTTDFISNIGVIFSKSLLVFIGVAFILSESKIFSKKLNLVLKNDKDKIHRFTIFSNNMQKYFTVKTFTSLLTGFFIYLVLIYYDIDYPLLWATIGFLFNFIPVVGSIIAAIPAILLSLMNLDINSVVWLTVIYVVINISISNVIEPKLMGKELGLSPMVIFFSLIFWGWVLGIVGMFLAVPITMTLKIAFESTESTKWIAIFMSSLKNK